VRDEIKGHTVTNTHTPYLHMFHLDEISLDDINIKTDVCLHMPYGIYTTMNLYLEQLTITLF